MNFLKKLFGIKSKPVAVPSYPNPYIGKKNPYLTQVVQAYKGVQPFNHNLAVAWALSLMEHGNQTPDVLMLASFSEPIDAFEIRPYIGRVLAGLGLPELEGDAAIRAEIRYYCAEILAGRKLRGNLRMLCDLANAYLYGFGLYPFYLLYHSWYNVEAGELNYYYQGATLGNIEDLAKMEAANWLAANFPEAPDF